MIYAHTGADLSQAGLTPSGAAEATLELILPEGQGVWPTPDVGDQRRTSLPLADPIQVLWDLRRGPGADSDEATERLWQLLRERHRRGQRADAS